MSKKDICEGMLLVVVVLGLFGLSGCQRDETVQLSSAWTNNVTNAMEQAGLPMKRDPQQECMTNCAEVENGCLDNCDQRIEYGNPARQPCHDECASRYKICVGSCKVAK